MSRIAFLATVLKGWNFLRRRLMIFSDTSNVRLHEILQIFIWSAGPKTSDEPTKYPDGQHPGDSHWPGLLLVSGLCFAHLVTGAGLLSCRVKKTGHRCCIGSWAY